MSPAVPSTESRLSLHQINQEQFWIQQAFLSICYLILISMGLLKLVSFLTWGAPFLNSTNTRPIPASYRRSPDEQYKDQAKTITNHHQLEWQHRSRLRGQGARVLSFYFSPVKRVPEKLTMPPRSGSSQHCCTLCNSRFSRSEHLLRHMLSHSGSKPHSCPVCNKAFTRR